MPVHRYTVPNLARGYAGNSEICAWAHALPHIGSDFGADVSALQWVLTGYLLALASLILLGGALGDRYGRRKVYRKLRISSRRDLANAIRDLDSPADDAIRRSSSQL